MILNHLRHQVGAQMHLPDEAPSFRFILFDDGVAFLVVVARKGERPVAWFDVFTKTSNDLRQQHAGSASKNLTNRFKPERRIIVPTTTTAAAAAAATTTAWRIKRNARPTIAGLVDDDVIYGATAYLGH